MSSAKPETVIKLLVATTALATIDLLIANVIIRYQEKKLEQASWYHNQLLDVIEAYYPYVPKDVAVEMMEKMTFEDIARRFKEK